MSEDKMNWAFIGTTSSDWKQPAITLEKLASMSYEMEDKKTSCFDFPKVSGFTRWMNKMGWHRNPTVYIVDVGKFNFFMKGVKL